MDAKNLNKRNRQRGLPEVEPIYTLEDAMNALEYFAPLEYETWIEPAKGHSRPLVECGPPSGVGLD